MSELVLIWYYLVSNYRKNSSSNLTESIRLYTEIAILFRINLNKIAISVSICRFALFRIIPNNARERD